MEDNQNFIGINVKNLLEAKKITVKDFASKLKVEIGLVEKWFSGEEKIAADYLQSISEVLSVSYERILNKPKEYTCIDVSKFTEFDFKHFLDVDFSDDIHVYRGQRNCFWPLMSSFCRFCKANRLKEEWNLLECEFCPVGSLENKDIIDTIKKECSIHKNGDVFRNMDNIQILAYLQHNGVPTPLLDWTYSPYVALFFAIKDSDPSDLIALYDFNLTEYKKDFPEDFIRNDDGANREKRDKPVTIKVLPSENINQLNQQGLFMYCKKNPNIEDYFQELYNRNGGKKYLSKKIFSLSGFGKKKIMESFKRMNITERTLFPDSTHVAKDIMNNLFVSYLKKIAEAFKR